MQVERYCQWDGGTGRRTGDFLRIGGVEFDLRAVVQLEYERAKRDHPHNPAFHMRPMFYTGSPHGAEITALGSKASAQA